MISILNTVIKAIANFLLLIISFLPKSPFSYIDNSGVKEFLGYINWIIPVDNIIAIGELWLVSVGIYYIYSVAMRWVKMIE